MLHYFISYPPFNRTNIHEIPSPVFLLLFFINLKDDSEDIFSASSHVYFSFLPVFSYLFRPNNRQVSHCQGSSFRAVTSSDTHNNRNPSRGNRMDAKCELWIWHGKKHQGWIRVSNSFDFFDLRKFFICIFISDFSFLGFI